MTDTGSENKAGALAAAMTLAENQVLDTESTGGNGKGKKPARIPPNLERKLGPPEKVLVRRRDDNGKIGPIGEYAYADLESSPNVDAFILRYVAPKYGPGEYPVSVIRRDGVEEPRAVVMVQPPRESQVLADPAAQINATVETVLKMHKEASEAAKERAKQEEERDAKLMTLFKEQGGGSGNLMQNLLMMRMMERPQVPAVDPSVSMVEGLKTIVNESMRPLVATVQELRHKVDNAPQAPLFPPMPSTPAVDPLEAIKTAAELLRPQQPAITPELIREIVRESQPKTESFGFKEVLAALPTMLPMVRAMLGLDRMDKLAEIIEKKVLDDKKQPDDMLASLEKLRLLKAVSHEINPPQGGDIWDKLLDPSYVEAIGDALGNVVNRMQGGPGSAPREGQPAEPEPTPADLSKDDYPDGFDAYVAPMNAAKTTQEMAVAVLGSLKFLWSAPAWKYRIYTLFTAARAGDKVKALAYLEAYLQGLGNSGKLTPPAKVQGAIEAFRQGADVFIKWAQQ